MPEEAIEVGARRSLWLGGSWRYIAVGLARGREAEEEEEEEDDDEEEEGEERGREKSRNLTTPLRRGGEQEPHS